MQLYGATYALCNKCLKEGLNKIEVYEYETKQAVMEYKNMGRTRDIRGAI